MGVCWPDDPAGGGDLPGHRLIPSPDDGSALKGRRGWGSWLLRPEAEWPLREGSRGTAVCEGRVCLLILAHPGGCPGVQQVRLAREVGVGPPEG